MDLATAIKTFQFAERAKSELIICSQLVTALSGFPDNERAGGKRMLIMVMESVRSELQFAYRGTEIRDFQNAINLMNEGISYTESDQFGSAALRLSESISAATTAAQGAWQVLSEHGLI